MRLSPSDFDAKFFGQSLANFLGQAVVHAPRPFFGRVEHGDWGGCRYRYAEPDQSR